MLRQCLAVLAVLLCPTVLLADGLIVIHNPPPSIPGHFAFAPLEVGYHRVSVKISDQVAVTTVEEEFINPSSAQLEGTYLFPLPPGAHIDRFTMDINGKAAEAELMTADKARSIYEDIVRRHRDPALLEYLGRDAFKVRIFPIEPHGKKQVRLQYTQLLKNDAGLTEYVYPLNTEKFSSAPLREAAISIELKTLKPLKSVYCPSHNAEVKRKGENEAIIGWEARQVRPDTDFKVVYSTGGEGVGLDWLTYRDGGRDGYFMLLASPGTVKMKGDAAAKDICFVLDTSGSMADDNKLEQVKKALEFCLSNLNEQDRFEIIRFSSEAEALFDGLQPADQGSVEKARAFVRGLKPTGGTALAEAVDRAIKLSAAKARASDKTRPYVVVLLTDGLPTVGEINEDRIVAAVTHHQDTPRIFTFGVGTDVNTHLLDRLAQETRGASQYVQPKEELELKLSSFYAKIKEPALTDLKLTLSDPEVALEQLYPKQFPDLFYGEQLIVMGKYRFRDTERTGSLRTAVKLCGRMAGKEVEFVNDITLPVRDTQRDFIPRLWATRRVGWLLDEIRLHGESAELKNEIVQLARQYGIVTPYTSFLILEDEDRRNVPRERLTMRQIKEDKALAKDAGDFYGGARAEAADPNLRTGGKAVENARRLSDLKSSWNMEQGAQDMPAAAAAPVPGKPISQSAQGYHLQTARSGQQARVVNGRAFYQNGTVWVDANAQNQSNLKQKEIKLGSEEYFALLKTNPALGPWLALGSEVDLVVDDTLYQVR